MKETKSNIVLYNSFNKKVGDSGLPVADVALGSPGEKGRSHGGVPPSPPAPSTWLLPWAKFGEFSSVRLPLPQWKASDDETSCTSEGAYNTLDAATYKPLLMAPGMSRFKPISPDCAVQDAGEPWAALHPSASLSFPRERTRTRGATGLS